MIIDERYIRRRNNTTRKPSSVQTVHGGNGRRYCRTLAVHISLRRCFINIHMQHSTVFVAFTDNIIPYFNIPTWICFPENKKFNYSMYNKLGFFFTNRCLRLFILGLSSFIKCEIITYAKMKQYTDIYIFLYN